MEEEEERDIFTLITGASSGIGAAVAERLEAEQKNLFLISRTVSPFQELPNDIIKIHWMADVCDKESFDMAVMQIPDESLTGVLLSAGDNRFTPHKFLEKEDLQHLLEINTIAPIHNLSALIKAKKLAKGASVVFVSSISAQRGQPGLVAYAASKGAIEAAVKTLALEYKKEEYRINAIACGLLDTPLTRRLENYYPEGLEGEMEKYPLKGCMEDIVNWITFLLSEKSGWLTGQVVTLDGGLSIS